MKEVLVLCPGNWKTGGVELLHQLCAELSKYMSCKLLYSGGDLNASEYREYGCGYTMELPRNFKGVLIFPEIWANDVLKDEYRDCEKVIYWMSVDNYFASYQEDEWLLFEDTDVLHIAQSYYALEWLLKARITTSPLLVSDYINDRYLSDPVYPIAKRKNRVLYNPKKGYLFTQEIMNSYDWIHDDIEFVPVMNFSKETMVQLMHSSKVYIDFGDHPGKDRIPREAAICGCCVITGMDGSAAFLQDVPIAQGFKFKRSTENIPLINAKIKDCIYNYDDEVSNFAEYRDIIKNEKATFEKQVKRFAEVLNGSKV